MSKKNIITGAVAALALILVVFVVLIETGVVDTRSLTQAQTVIESEIIVVSETNDQGEIEYITMVTKYARPKVTSNHRYPTKKQTTTVPRETTTEVRYVEQSSYVHITDVNGIPQFNDDGTPVTEVVTYTIAEQSLTQPTTAEPKTSAVAVTSPDGVAQTDVSGNPVTEVITYIETTTKGPDIWSENTKEGTTKAPLIQSDVNRDDALAQAIVDQINADRKENGLEPLEHTTNLKAKARTNSMALALPDIYGNNNSSAYTLVTKYGGNPVYQQVAAANRDKIMSADITQIGVGVVKANDQYYTSVYFG